MQNAPASVKKRHFETFDAMRFFACIKVFILHVPIVAFPFFNVIKAGGGIGVLFFFVLSGFLITYIIYEEKQQAGQLNLKHFFIRRILRIWPLFYFMIGVAFITPYIFSYLHINNTNEGYEPNWRMSLLFLENYKMILTNKNPNVSPLAVMWSLCVEEHFYIIWGITLYFTPIRQLPKVIITCLIISVIARVVFWHYHLPTNEILTNIDLFAFGAIPAYLLIYKPESIRRLAGNVSGLAKRMFIIILLLLVTLCSQFCDQDGPFIILTTVLGAFFSILIILTLPVEAGGLLRIDDKNWFSRMGIYTYGFYLYHTLVLNLCKKIFEKLDWPVDKGGYAVVFVATTFIVTLLCSMLSYHLFEKQFLKMKKYFR